MAGAYLYVAQHGNHLIALVQWINGRSRVRFFGLDCKPVVLQKRRTGRPIIGHVTVECALACGYFVPLVPHDWKGRNDRATVAGDAKPIPATHKDGTVWCYWECVDAASGYCELRSHDGDALVCCSSEFVPR